MLQECKPPAQQPLPRAPDRGEMSECHAEHQAPSICQQTVRERGTEARRRAGMGAHISSLED